MIYETKITNKFGGEIDYPSPVSGFLFKIPEDGFLIYRTTDPLNILARYSEIIFLPGRVEHVQSSAESNVLTKKLYFKGLKCIVRKGWEEPERKFPTTWFINQGNVPLEVVKPDCFDQNLSIFLFQDLPVLSSVPCYSIFAKHKKYTIHEPILTPSQRVGAIAGAVDALENRELTGERTKQELERLQRMIKDWKETQRNTVKIM
jgi:hypothetical protein